MLQCTHCSFQCTIRIWSIIFRCRHLQLHSSTSVQISVECADSQWWSDVSSVFVHCTDPGTELFTSVLYRNINSLHLTRSNWEIQLASRQPCYVQIPNLNILLDAHTGASPSLCLDGFWWWVVRRFHSDRKAATTLCLSEFSNHLPKSSIIRAPLSPGPVSTLICTVVGHP